MVIVILSPDSQGSGAVAPVPSTYMIWVCFFGELRLPRGFRPQPRCSSRACFPLFHHANRAWVSRMLHEQFAQWGCFTPD